MATTARKSGQGLGVTELGEGPPFCVFMQTLKAIHKCNQSTATLDIQYWLLQIAGSSPIWGRIGWGLEF